MDSRKRALLAVAVVAVVSAASYAAYSWAGSTGPTMITYSADAYVQESNFLLSSFHNSTGYSVAPAVGGGSFSDARAIGQGVPADVFISASVDAYNQSYLEGRYSGWAIAFSGDQLVLAYSNATLSSPTASEIVRVFQSAYGANGTSFYFDAFSNLTSGRVSVGIATPADDPAGVRAWLALEMAGYLYASGNASYFTTSIERNGGNISAISAADLVAPLEVGNIQFLFIYKSAAVAKGLAFITLPDALNQGSANLTAFYSKFSYDLPTGAVHGSPIFLYVSVLSRSSDSDAAYAFVYFVVNNTSLLSRFGISPLATPIVYASGPLPSGIAALVARGALAYGGPI